MMGHWYKNYLLLVVVILGSSICTAQIIQDLGGDWVVADSDNVITANATVPGGIYSDLMNAQIIDDIFYGMGDEEELWISFLDWTYSTTFTIDETILANNVVNIVFDGLDTFCTILINDVEVGRGQNMFIRYIFPIKEHLQLGINSLQVKFFSAVNTAAELAEKQNENYVVPPECPTPESRGACHANFARKMQASFSWDWGPSFPSVGIWKNVYLEAFNDAVIRDVVVKTTEFSGDDVWNLEYTVYLSTEGADQAVGTITMVLNMDDGIDLAAMSDVDATINEYGEIAVANSVNISMSDVRRWWPNGYGDAVLYNLSIDYTSSGSNEKTSKNLRIGFRTVQVVQDQLDSGLSFYFVVNGVPVFAKGANSIPLNVLPERGQDPNTVRNILESAADVHMNMLRVWGGGVYESDYFYETTDELGIMIWQDFMFACAMYPTDDNFLGHVTEEVNHQVKRIFNHPSVVVFAGNNENEAALIQNWYQTSDNYELYKTDYIKLYVTTIRDEVYRVLGSTNFLVSSPTNGQESEAEGYIASNPGDPLYGDVHYYNYQSDSFNDRNFPIPRFSSEFGYQSMPDESAWLTATNDISNLHPASDFVDHRQHHPNGLAENTALIGLQLTLPDESSENYYKAYIYYSQILQAMSIKIETEHYRRYMGRYDEMGQGNTMGALYWQLSDVWVAPTWSGIDFTGRWKMLHYFAKNFFAPLIISPEITDDNQLEVYVVNDAPTGLATNLNAVVQVFTWTSLQPLSDNVYPIAIEPGNVVSATSFAIEEQLASSGCGDYPTSSVNCFFVFYITDDEENVVTFKNFYFPSKLKDSNIQTPNLQIASVLDGLGLGEFEITVSTDTVTPFVWLDSHEISGRFSENGFLMLSETKTVTFKTSTSISAAELQLILTITSLRDSTYT